MKRIVLFGLAAFFLFLVADDVRVRQSTKPFPVLMTGKGFFPRKIDVPAGTQILFINKDTVDHWPASEVHPNHAISPYFDAKRNVKPGRLFRYRPLQPDFIKMHDHLFPFSKATLIVRDSPGNNTLSIVDRIDIAVGGLIDDIKNRLTNIPSPPQFLKLTEKDKYKRLKVLARREGAVATWKFLESAYAGEKPEDAFNLVTHNVGHYAGWKLYDEKGIDGLVYCTPGLSYGCYHGIADRVLMDNPDGVLAMEQACYKGASGNLATFANCIHGVGHAIAMNVEPDNFAAALSVCDTMKYSPASCYKGAFMEMGVGAPVGSMHEPIEDKSDLFSLCLGYDEKYRTSCAGQVLSVIEKMNKLTSTDVIPYCIRAKDEHMRIECVTYIGKKAAVRANGNKTLIIDRCNAIPAGPLRSLCISVALLQPVGNTFPDEE